MLLSKKIIVIDNVLTKDECDKAVKSFNFARVRNSLNIEIYRDTIIYHISEENEFLFSLTSKIKDSIKFMTNDIEPDWSHIVEWKNGSRQEYHKDKQSDNTVFTSITYLNNDYVGGETSFINDISVVPKVGRTVYFDGNHYVHGVKEITKGIRYTLPIWYKNISVV